MIQYALLAVMSVTAPDAALRTSSISTHGVVALGMDEVDLQALEAAIVGQLESYDRVTLVQRDPSLAGLCGGRQQCHCEEARKADAPHALYGNVAQIDDLYSVELVLLDVRTCRVENALFVLERHHPSGLAERVQVLTHRLLVHPESVSQTAVKTEREVERVPAVVSVFSESQMRLFGLTRIEELFPIVPEFEMVDTNWGGTVLHHGLMGTVLYMIDGVPLSNAKQSFRFLSRDFRLSLNGIERVEFVRGPGSVLWGANALLGVVNVVTQKPRREDLEPRVHLRVGTLNTQEVFASVGQNRGALSYGLSVTFNQSAGPSTFLSDSVRASVNLPPGTSPMFGNAGGTQNRQDRYLDIQGTVKLSNRLELLIKHISHRDHFEISPFGSLLPEEAPGTWDKSHRIYSIAWEDAAGGGFRYRLSASQYEYTSWEDFVIHPRSDAYPEGFRSLQGNEIVPTLSRQGEARLFHDADFSLIKNRAILGASLLHQVLPNNYTNVGSIFTDPRNLKLDFRRRSFTTAAVFLHDELMLGPYLNLSGGLRYEHRGEFAPVLNKQAALIVSHPFVGAKLIYSEGFRLPTANFLYSTSGTEGNAALLPEQSRELGLELSRRVMERLFVRAGGSIGEIYNLIVLDPDAASEGFAYKAVNQGSVGYLSASTEIRGQLHETVELFGSVGYKRLEETTSQQERIPVSPWSASLGLNVRPMNDFSLFAVGAWNAARHILLLRPEEGPVRHRVPANTRIDAGLSVENVFRGISLDLSVRNPVGFTRFAPYRVDGTVAPLVEPRNDAEIIFTARWTPNE